MLAKVLGAIVGKRVAGRGNKLGGAVIGAAVPAIARRGLGAVGLAVAAGWGAKKLVDRARDRRSARSGSESGTRSG